MCSAYFLGKHLALLVGLCIIRIRIGKIILGYNSNSDKIFRRYGDEQAVKTRDD